MNITARIIGGKYNGQIVEGPCLNYIQVQLKKTFGEKDPNVVAKTLKGDLITKHKINQISDYPVFVQIPDAPLSLICSAGTGDGCQEIYIYKKNSPEVKDFSDLKEIRIASFRMRRSELLENQLEIFGCATAAQWQDPGMPSSMSGRIFTALQFFAR